MITNISKDDIPEILEIEKESFISPWSERLFLSELDNELGLNFCFRENGKLIGYIFSWCIFEDMHINNIAVAYYHRRKGIGKKLLKYVIDIALTKGATTVLLEVRTSNTSAQEFYSNLGFTLLTVRPKYYSDTYEDALVLFAKINEMKWE